MILKAHDTQDKTKSVVASEARSFFDRAEFLGHVSRGRTPVLAAEPAGLPLNCMADRMAALTGRRAGKVSSLNCSNGQPSANRLFSGADDRLKIFTAFLQIRKVCAC
jgi:hypothetical protein